MTTSHIMDTLGWGFILWLIGYVLGIIFFAFVPPAYLGWSIMPFGIAVTLWVLLKKVKATTMGEYVRIALAWTLIAIVCDCLFLVLLLHPVGGYYKLDVYLYYAITFALPIVAGWAQVRGNKK